MHSSCKYLKDARLYERIIFMPNVSLYLKFSSMADRKGAWELWRKTKGKIDLEKVSPFHSLGLLGFLDMCECLSRMLSDYSMAPTAAENINTVWPDITSWQRQEGAPNSNVFHREWGMSIFPLKWSPCTWRIEIACTSPVWEVNDFIQKSTVLSSPDLFSTLQGTDDILFISMHLEGRNQVYWVPVRYSALAQALHRWCFF